MFTTIGSMPFAMNNRLTKNIRAVIMWLQMNMILKMKRKFTITLPRILLIGNNEDLFQQWQLNQAITPTNRLESVAGNIGISFLVLVNCLCLRC